MESTPNKEAPNIRAGEAIAIRATLVVGIIAAILALRLNPQLIQGASLSPLAVSLTNVLLLYWSLYAVTMAIGIEEKPFGPQFAKLCFRMSYNFFLVGVMLTGFAALLVLLPFLWPSFLLELMLTGFAALLVLLPFLWPSFLLELMSSLGLGKFLGTYLVLGDLVHLAEKVLAIRRSKSILRNERRPLMKAELWHAIVVGVVAIPLFFLP
jgi:hypothetical protein